MAEEQQKVIAIRKSVDGSGRCRLEASCDGCYLLDAKRMPLVTNFMSPTAFAAERDALEAALKTAVLAAHPAADVRSER